MKTNPIIFGLLVLANPVFAATTTELEGGIILDGSTVPSGMDTPTLTPDSNGDIQIDATIGTGSGGNLFHSFDEFNVQSDETAVFTDSTGSGYENVIARVTGTDDSDIYGGIRTGAGLEGANLFLINPNGVLFGNGATVNVQGAFYVSTADTLYFGEQHDVALNMSIGDVNFSSAPISAFGFTDVSADTSVSFIDNHTIDIQKNPDPTVSEGEFAIIADNVEIRNSTLNVSDSKVSINTGATGAVIALDSSGPANNPGEVLIENSTLNLNGSNNLSIRSGRLTLLNSNITQNAGTNAQAPDINIELSGDLLMDNSDFLATADDGYAANFTIAADNVEIRNGSTLTSGAEDYFSFGFFPVNAGDISITANSVVLAGISRDQTVAAGSDTVENTGIFSNGDWNGGSNGDIYIEASSIEMSNNAQIKSENGGDYSGSITLVDGNAQGSLSMTSGSHITLNCASPTALDCGGISLDFRQIDISGADSYTGGDPNVIIDTPTYTGIETNTDPYAKDGASLTINAENFSLTNSAKITLRSADDGSGANLTLTAKNIVISGSDAAYASFVQGTAYEPGAGIEIFHESNTRSDNPVSGTPGGLVDLRADRIEITDSGHIKIAEYNDGPAKTPGKIQLSANEISIRNHGFLSTRYILDYDYTPNADIEITARDSLIIENSYIESGVFESTAIANGGNISIQAEKIAIISSRIDTSTLSSAGGNINISANYGFITTDSLITASSVASVDGEITISKNINYLSRGRLSIQKTSAFSVDLKDKCADVNTEDSSLQILSNVNPIAYEGAVTANYEQIQLFSRASPALTGDCMKTASL